MNPEYKHILEEIMKDSKLTANFMMNEATSVFEEMNDIKYFIEDLLQKERTRTIAEVMGLVESIKPIVGWNTEHIGRNELLKDLNSLK